MLKNPLLLIALIITGAIAVWGIVDTTGLAAFSSHLVSIQFTSRAWFIMLAVSFMLVTSVWLALSRYGRIKLGKDDDEPEFSTISSFPSLIRPLKPNSIRSIISPPRATSPRRSTNAGDRRSWTACDAGKRTPNGGPTPARLGHSGFPAWRGFAPIIVHEIAPPRIRLVADPPACSGADERPAAFPEAETIAPQCSGKFWPCASSSMPPWRKPMLRQASENVARHRLILNTNDGQNLCVAIIRRATS